MVTDGRASFVIFLYADGLIQWLNRAQVGINAGDGVRFFSHPDSNMVELLDITFTSNVGKPGMWVIRTDREGILIQDCKNGRLYITNKFILASYLHGNTCFN